MKRKPRAQIESRLIIKSSSDSSASVARIAKANNINASSSSNSTSSSTAAAGANDETRLATDSIDIKTEPPAHQTSAEARDLAIKNYERKAEILKAKGDKLPGSAAKQLNTSGEIVETEGHKLVIANMYRKKNQGTIELLKLLNQTVEQKSKAYYAYEEALKAAPKLKKKSVQKNKNRSSTKKKRTKKMKPDKRLKKNRGKKLQKNVIDEDSDDEEPLTKLKPMRRKIIHEEEDEENDSTESTRPTYDSGSSEAEGSDISENKFLEQVSRALGWMGAT